MTSTPQTPTHGEPFEHPPDPDSPDHHLYFRPSPNIKVETEVGENGKMNKTMRMDGDTDVGAIEAFILGERMPKAYLDPSFLEKEKLNKNGVEETKSRGEEKECLMAGMEKGTDRTHGLERTSVVRGWISSDLQAQQDKVLIGELKAAKKTQEELILELKIKVAVLEQKVQGKEDEVKDAREAVRVLGVMLGQHGKRDESTQAASQKGRVEELEKEFRMLTSMNEQLWSRIEGRFADRNLGGGYEGGRERSGLREDLIPNHEPKGKERKRDAFMDESFAARRYEALDTSRPHHEDGNYSTMAPGHPHRSRDHELENSMLWLETPDPIPGQAVEGDIPTVPNSPVIGAASIDDTFQYPQPLSGKVSKLLEIAEGGIDEQILKQMGTMIQLADLPKPDVWKTGFELDKSFRGRDYDAIAHAPKFPRRMGMRSYNRFAPAESFDGAPLFRQGDGLEIPKYRSFGNEVYKSEEEREGAIEKHVRECVGRDKGLPDFFRYGIRYVPLETDTNFLRAVLISNLPKDIELREVLQRVRGGEIHNATLCDTTTLTGSKTAMVVFINEAAAQEYIKYVSEHPILFGDDGDERKAEFELIRTPTYPLSLGQKRRISGAYKQTRCLMIQNFPASFPFGRLEDDLAGGYPFRAAHLLDLYVDEEATLHLEFSNFWAAGSAYGILTGWTRYTSANLRINFTPDPCSGPVSELSLPLPPRRPVRPRNRVSFDESSGDDVIEEVQTVYRKSLGALNEKVLIPSFSGAKIKGESWADEVIEEIPFDPNTGSAPVQTPTSYSASPGSGSNSEPGQEDSYSAVPPKSLHSEAEGKGVAILDIITEDVNRLMVSTSFPSSNFRKPPVGLAASKYASLVPAFEEYHPARIEKRKLQTVSISETVIGETSGSNRNDDRGEIAGDVNGRSTAGLNAPFGYSQPAFPDSDDSSSPTLAAQSSSRQVRAMSDSPRVKLEHLLADSPPASPAMDHASSPTLPRESPSTVRKGENAKLIGVGKRNTAPLEHQHIPTLIRESAFVIRKDEEERLNEGEQKALAPLSLIIPSAVSPENATATQNDHLSPVSEHGLTNVDFSKFALPSPVSPLALPSPCQELTPQLGKELEADAINEFGKAVEHLGGVNGQRVNGFVVGGEKLADPFVDMKKSNPDEIALDDED
jgi:hypothetical protein